MNAGLDEDVAEWVASMPMVIRQWLSEHPEALVLLATWLVYLLATGGW